MTTYQCYEQQKQDADTTYTTYGIAAYTEDAVPICTVADVFLDRAEAAAFAARCTELHLDPLHLNDVIADTVGVTSLL